MLTNIVSRPGQFFVPPLTSHERRWAVWCKCVAPKALNTVAGQRWENHLARIRESKYDKVESHDD